MISVIIPVWNMADSLKECLDSIASQSFKEYEIVIVDDGSLDNPANIYQEFQANNPHLRTTFYRQENAGACAARNKGAEISTGDLLLFCDADIKMNPRMLEQLHAALLSNPDKAYAYPIHRFAGKLFKSWPFSAERLKQMPYIHTSALIRREYFPGFDPHIRKFQDWDLWLNILINKGGEGLYVPELLFEVRGGGTMSSWLPSFFYRAFPFLPAVKKYNQAVWIIKKKYNI